MYGIIINEKEAMRKRTRRVIWEGLDGWRKRNEEVM